jgi:hypothetical protein
MLWNVAHKEFVANAATERLRIVKATIAAM